MTHQTKAGGRPTRQESEARRQRLLAIAQRRFLTGGYRETSLESIVREAGIAKKTLYHQYGSKAGLFATILGTLRNSWIAELSDIVLDSHPPKPMLERVALHLLDVGTRPDMIALHRLLLTEAHRFPELIGSHYDKKGGLRGMEPLADYLGRAKADGALKIGDVALATEQFLYLVLGGIRARLLLGTTRRPAPALRRRIAREAVQVFLAGYAAGGVGVAALTGGEPEAVRLS